MHRPALNPTWRHLALPLLFALGGSALAAPPPLAVARVTPAGVDVAAARQIVIDFNRPVVPLGRMERRADELPLTITPALECQWRWISREALACQLGEQTAMAPATRYTLSLQPGALAADGSTLAAPYQQQFTTERPTVSQLWFKTWRHPGVPVLRATFNQAVTRASVERHLLFLAPSLQLEVGLSASPDPNDRELPLAGGEEGGEARRIWLLEPLAPLPPDQAIHLQQSAGLVSALGPEAGVARGRVLSFHTFPAFRLLGLRCTSNAGERLLLAPGADASRRCDPLAGLALAFTSPVLFSDLKRATDFSPALAQGSGDDPWARQGDYSRLGQPHQRGASYDYWLPARLRAWASYELRFASGDATLVDEFGRPLAPPAPLVFHTDHRRPDFALTHRDAVLEAGIDSELPLTVTNLDRVELGYRTLGVNGAGPPASRSLAVPPARDVAFAIPLGVRQLLAGQSGAVYGHLAASPRVERRNQRDRRFFAQVTPYQVHAKLGHFNTLVWVTDLATGKPVTGARVAVYRDRLSRLGPMPAGTLSATTDPSGTARLPGTETLDPSLGTLGWRCSGDDCERLFVRVDGPEGMALLPLNGSYRVNVSRASGYTLYLNQRREYGHLRSWGLTAQGVYRAGDTMAYKLYVRGQDNETLVPAPDSHYQLELVDPTGKVVHRREGLTLNAFGALQGEYPVPANSAMGWYRFRLKADFTDHEWQPMRVLVSDFTPAPFRVESSLNGDRFRIGDELRATSTATLHAGGPFGGTEARLTVNLQATPFRPRHPVARQFAFDTAGEVEQLQVYQGTRMLDAKGSAEEALRLEEGAIAYGRLVVESAVRDDRGQFVTARSGADYVAIERLVGLRKQQWVFRQGEAAQVEYLAVDDRGEPVSDTPVRIAVERLETRAARVKGAGNAYLPRFTEHWGPVASCAGQPRGEPLGCRFTPDAPGRYRVVASVTDSRGRHQSSTLWAWVTGDGPMVWREDPGYALSLVPEEDEYRIGDTARFLIKNPFPGATALVTVERYGVLRQWQTRLEGNTPILEVPVEAAYAPGAYLSVLVFSPRVEPPPSAASGQGIDLGKPAFRIAYTPLVVRDPYRELEVSARTGRDSYKPREKVAVTLEARPAQAGPTAEPLEFAVVVLDEAVFDLIAGGRDYFDPYRGFFALDGLDVDNYSLLTQLVGRQRFERKGATSGGDGGGSLPLRSLFRYVSYWNPSLAADADGRARFEFTLPDNLTGWRVLALAATPSDRFGLGEVSFKTHQPTELRPALPNQVGEGDRFEAGFTVLNRTGQPRTLEVAVEASGDAMPVAPLRQRLSLAPYARRTVYLPVEAATLPAERERPTGAIEFRVRAGDADDGDALTVALPVHKRRSLTVAADYGSTTGERLGLPLVLPAAIAPDSGELAVQLAPSVLGNVGGAFRYLRDYGHQCWEQVLSRGVMASHFESLKPWLDPAITWPDSEALPAATLARAAGYQAPNGGMSYFLPQDAYVSPYLSAYTALAFSWLRQAGHAVPAPVEDALHAYLGQLLRRDVLPDFYSAGMAASVRAVALNALAASGRLEPGDLERHARHLQSMDLFGAANLLQAAEQTEGADAIGARARARILAQSSASGGKLAFNDPVDSGYARLLATPMRSNCAVLSALATDRDPATSTDQLAAIARSIVGSREGRDHWQNTQENLFCTRALIDYAARAERLEPALEARVTLDGETLGEAAFAGYRAGARLFTHPLGPRDQGRKADLAIAREGEGRLYYEARLSYAPEDADPAAVNAGMELRREFSVQRKGGWSPLAPGDAITRGELVRVDLYLSLPTARPFVVVEDPVAGGLEPVNRDLATASAEDAGAGEVAPGDEEGRVQGGDWIPFGASRWSFYHRELGYGAVRFYADYLPPGRYHLSYTAQAIAAGDFAVRPAHAREMYDTDIYGKTPPFRLRVSPAP